MKYELYQPVTDPSEIEDLLAEAPLAIDRERFLAFALGFPRQYLFNTPRIEIVKHFFLFEGSRGTAVISSLSRQDEQWKLSLMTPDRTFLFSRIVACLSCFGANIRSAEAFANSNSMVLDTFLFQDSEQQFTEEPERLQFQHLLQQVVEGKVDLTEQMQQRRKQVQLPADYVLEASFDNDSHETATRIQLKTSDHFGLLYLVSQVLAEEGCSIEIASIRTVGETVNDEFYVTYQGSKLPHFKQRDLAEELSHLSRHFSDASSAGEGLN